MATVPAGRLQFRARCDGVVWAAEALERVSLRDADCADPHSDFVAGRDLAWSRCVAAAEGLHTAYRQYRSFSGQPRAWPASSSASDLT
jgi:hypothetical protein